MALNVTTINDPVEKATATKVLVYLLQYALENDADFVDHEDLQDWILGATDREQEWVENASEQDLESLLTDINVLLSIVFEEEDYDGELKVETVLFSVNEASDITLEELDGNAEGLTIEDIAEIHGVSIDQISEQLDKGIQVEYEHTSDEEIAKRIALDHLFEIPDYYDRLEIMEEDAKESMKNRMM